MFWSICSRPKFTTQMPQLFIIKICFTIKVNSICGAGGDTRNQGLRVASPKSQGTSSRVLGVRVPCFRVPESQGPGFQSPGSQRPRVLNLRVPILRVPGSRGLGSRVSGFWSRVSRPDIRLCPFVHQKQQVLSLFSFDDI